MTSGLLDSPFLLCLQPKVLADKVYLREKVAKGAALRPATLCGTELDDLVQLSEGIICRFGLSQRKTDIV
jgi:hypothetical protein